MTVENKHWYIEELAYFLSYLKGRQMTTFNGIKGNKLKIDKCVYSFQWMIWLCKSLSDNTFGIVNLVRLKETLNNE